jgi:hypothetical protein
MSGTCCEQGDLDETPPTSGFEVSQDARHRCDKRGDHPRNTELSLSTSAPA